MSLVSCISNDKQTYHHELATPQLIPTPFKGRKLALISGAGIAGLAASFELKARGFAVIIVEKRKDFSRFNLINLNREVQPFLRKFNLLEEFETSVAARIEEHKIVVFGERGARPLLTSDVSELNFNGSLEKNPEKFAELFKEDGIYSLQIKGLQTFLTEKAEKFGIQIVRESEVKILNPLPGERVTKVEIFQTNAPSLVVEPDLFFIAEGAHSTSITQLGMANDTTDVVKNACTDENWIFGNFKYAGDKTFVISIVDTSQKILQIANVIFNAKSQVVNIAVTSEDNADEDRIIYLLRSTAKKAFNYAGIKQKREILDKVKKPVHIANRMASNCSMANVFRIGDAVGHSSPLAGLGGTLGLTLVPSTLEQLLDDYLSDSDELHENFKKFSQAYVTKWICKSQSVKEGILTIFEKDQIVNEPKKEA